MKRRVWALLALHLGLAAFLFSPTPARAEAPPPFVLAWGSYGTGFGQFRTPTGVAADPGGTLRVIQLDSPCRVQQFRSDGSYLSQLGSCGSGDGQFNYGYGVAVDGSGNLYTVEVLGARIQKFSPNGTFLLKWGSYGTGNGQFNHPSGVAVDGNGNVYVADRYNNRIQKFNSSGAFLLKWGSGGTGNGQFDYPIGIAVDGANNVYVTDRNDRVQKFSSAGAFLGAFGSPGTGDGQFADPSGIAVDGQGRLYVVDTNNHRIQKFSSNFSFLSKWGQLGSGPGQFFSPSHAVVGTDGYLYVADVNNHRIQKFGPVSSGSGGGNTPVGQNVLVQLVPDTDLVYSQVVTAGQTDLSLPSAGPAPPGGFQTVPASPRKYYDLTTSAGYMGSIEVVIEYDPSDVRGQESALRLFHWDESQTPPTWRDITTSVQTGPNIIRGVTPSLSTFAILEPSAPTGIAEDLLATGVGLRASVPNPFRSRTTLGFELAEPATVEIQVLDLQGRRIRDLLPPGEFGAGSHEVVWDGRDGSGARVGSGLYFFRLITPRAAATQKIILVD